jgi:hypothetical protein
MIAPAFFKRARMGDWFKKGGDTYRMVPDGIDRLPKGLQNRAIQGYRCIMRFLARRELDPMSATNPAMADEAGWSLSFMKDAFRILAEPYELVDDPEAEGGVRKVPLPPFIIRDRQRGRRQFLPGKGLTLKGSSPAPADPLCTPPPEKREDQETTTTGGRPSSFPEIAPDGTEGRREAPAPELVDRACKLIPEATPEWVAAMVAVFPSEWFSQALDEVEERNRKPGNRPVYRRRFVTIKLESWAAGGGPPRRVKAAPAATAKPEAPKDDPAKIAREKRIGEVWGLMPEPEKEAIRAAVRAEQPDIVRFERTRPIVFEAACLAALAKRLEPAEPRAP